MTHYVYGADGRVLYTQPEVEWDDTEQEWMRARAAWRDEHLCPLCGFPREVCQAPETEFELDDPVRTRCHVTTRMRAAQKAYSQDPTSNPEGLLWSPQFKKQGTPEQ